MVINNTIKHVIVGQYWAYKNHVVISVINYVNETLIKLEDMMFNI